MKSKLLAINKYAVLIIISMMVCNGVHAGMTKPDQDTKRAQSILPESEWQKFVQRTTSEGQSITWKIRVTGASAFGGFYVKGHLFDDKREKVHLLWPPENLPASVLRQKLVPGCAVTVRGNFDGVTQEKEVIIRVEELL